MTDPADPGNLATVSLDDSIQEITRRIPLPPKPRTVYGKWVAFAWQARALVDRNNWQICDAIRHVIVLQNLQPADRAFGGIRSAYYTIRDRPWPE